MTDKDTKVDGQRRSRFSDKDENRDRSREDRSREKEPRTNCRVYISNIPYDFRWQDLKDLFRRVVGSVEYVELFNDENGKPRGCGIVEFKDPENVDKALEKMNRHEVNGRELVVKEDHGENRDQYGRIVKDGGRTGGERGGRDDRFPRRDDDRISSRSGMLDNFGNGNISYNTYGLSASFLESLGINGPLHNKIFVANLDYKVDSKKLKQVFKLAGKVQGVELSLDKDGNSRGFAVIEYDHPVEAVQAISMLDRQMLYERRMTVRLDRIPDKNEMSKLPDGLGGIGVGLGPGGEPLKDVARNLPNQNQNKRLEPQPQQPQIQQAAQHLQSSFQQSSNSMNPIIQPSLNNVGGVSNNANLLGNASSGGSNNLDLTNLNNLRAALSNNPLLSSNLSSLGINLGGGGGGQSSNDQSLSNNYSTGNTYSSGFGNNDYGAGQQNSSVGGMYDSLRSQFADNDYNAGGGSGGGAYASSGRKSDTIIIKNIPLTCTWQTLRDKFRDIGEVKFAEIRGNDVGVVRFFKEKDAEVAIKLMDGSRMDGRTVSVAFF